MDMFKRQMENVTNQDTAPQFSRFTCHGCETSFPNVEFLHEHVSILHEGEEQFYCGKCDSFFASEVDYTVHLSQHAKPAKRKSTEEAPSFGDSHNVLNEAYDMAVASNLPGMLQNIPGNQQNDAKRPKMTYMVQKQNQPMIKENSFGQIQSDPAYSNAIAQAITPPVFTNHGGVPVQQNNNNSIVNYQKNLQQINQEQNNMKLLQAAQVKNLQNPALQKLQPKGGLPQPVVMYPNNVPGARIEKVFDRNGKVIGQRIVNSPMPIQQNLTQKPAVTQVVSPKIPISQNQITFGQSPHLTQQPKSPTNVPSNVSLLKASPTNQQNIQIMQNNGQNIMNSAKITKLPNGQMILMPIGANGQAIGQTANGQRLILQNNSANGAIQVKTGPAGQSVNGQITQIGNYKTTMPLILKPIDSKPTTVQTQMPQNSQNLASNSQNIAFITEGNKLVMLPKNQIPNLMSTNQVSALQMNSQPINQSNTTITPQTSPNIITSSKSSPSIITTPKSSPTVIANTSKVVTNLAGNGTKPIMTSQPSPTNNQQIQNSIKPKEVTTTLFECQRCQKRFPTIDEIKQHCELHKREDIAKKAEQEKKKQGGSEQEIITLSEDESEKPKIKAAERSEAEKTEEALKKALSQDLIFANSDQSVTGNNILINGKGIKSDYIQQYHQEQEKKRKEEEAKKAKELREKEAKELREKQELMEKQQKLKRQAEQERLKLEQKQQQEEKERWWAKLEEMRKKEVLTPKNSVNPTPVSVVGNDKPTVGNDQKSSKNTTIYKCTHCKKPYFTLPEVQNHNCVKEAQRKNQLAGKTNDSTNENSVNSPANPNPTKKNEVTIYKCSLCEKPFLTLPEVRSHNCTKGEKSSPKTGQSPQNPKKDVTIYKCSLCQNPFLTIQEARNHDCPKANTKKSTSNPDPKTAEKPNNQGVTIKKPIQPVKKPTAPTEDVCFVSVDEPIDHNATTKSSPKAVQNPKPNNSPKVYVQNSKASSSSKVTIEKPKQSAEQTTVFVDDWIKNKSPNNAPKLVENVKTSTTPNVTTNKVLYGKLKPKPAEPVDMTADYMSALNEDATFDFAENNAKESPKTSTSPKASSNEPAENVADDIKTALNEDFLFDFVDCEGEMIGIDEEDKIAVEATNTQKNVEKTTNSSTTVIANSANNNQKEPLKVNSRIEVQISQDESEKLKQYQQLWLQKQERERQEKEKKAAELLLQRGTEQLGNRTEPEKKKTKDFDIDRIVIPKSMYVDKIEILKYEEIPTPSFKNIETNNSSKSIPTEENNLYEDISDQAFILRHSKAEIEERKRLTQPLYSGNIAYIF